MYVLEVTKHHITSKLKICKFQATIYHAKINLITFTFRLILFNFFNIKYFFVAHNSDLNISVWKIE
jgi:hypothetical protein